MFGRRNRRWHIAGSMLVPAVQAVVFGIGLRQLAAQVERPWLFWGAARGLLVTVMIVVAAAVALIVLTEVVALVARLKYGWSARGYRQAWGWAAGLTHHAMVPLLLIGTALAIRWADGATSEASVGSAAGDLQRGRLPDRGGLAAAEDRRGLPAGGHRRSGRADRAGVRVRPVVGPRRPGHRGHRAGPRRQRGPRASGLSRRTAPAGHPGRAAACRASPTRSSTRSSPPAEPNPVRWCRTCRRTCCSGFGSPPPGWASPADCSSRRSPRSSPVTNRRSTRDSCGWTPPTSELVITLHQVFGETPAATIPVATLPLTRGPVSAD